jgi:hypothetical protein
MVENGKKRKINGIKKHPFNGILAATAISK